MRTQKIYFPNQQALCVFPDARAGLVHAISELRLEENCAVIVLIGGGIDEKQAAVTRRAIQVISKFNDLITVVPANSARKIVEVIQALLSAKKAGFQNQLLMGTPL